jgi:hypothetical protein
MKILSILFIFVFGLSVFGQTFSTDWQKVPMGFQGDDVEKIYRILSKSPNLKGKTEFETTADYQKRISDLSKIPLPNKSADSVLTFIYHPKFDSYSSKLTSKYDADAQTLEINLEVRTLTYVIDNENLGLTRTPSVMARDVDLKPMGTYEGETAYGVKRTIERSLMTYYFIGINNANSFSGIKSGYDRRIKFTLPLAPAKAKEIKENLAVLYVGKLVSPFSALSGSRLKPTVDKPRDLTVGEFILTMNVSDIWFYNSTTGEVVAKFNPKK